MIKNENRILLMKGRINMKSMPYKLKQKIRQYALTNKKAMMLYEEILDELNKYGVPSENLTALSSSWNDEPYTEGLAFINNNEGDLESNIEEIEEIFLYFANNN